MSDTLSIGWSRSQADARLHAHRRVLGLSLGLQSLIAVAVLVSPAAILGIIGFTDEPAFSDWARVWAVMVLFVSALQIPGYIDPVFNRLPNVIGVVGRFGMVVLYVLLGGTFYWLAAFDGVFAVLLALSYRRLVLAELMTRP